jgi:hypothetical protein
MACWHVGMLACWNAATINVEDGMGWDVMEWNGMWVGGTKTKEKKKEEEE